jgi:hypothetical protein
MHKLLSIFAILLVYALGSIAGGANPDDSAANSKFKPGDRVWTTADLKVRSGPGLDFEQIDSMADGNSMIKGNTGTILEGPVSKDEYTWWKISYDIGITGWSAEKYLELASNGPKQPDNFAPWSDDAVKWATDKDRIGSRNWNGECLRFVSNAFRQKDASGESGWSSAISAARDLYRFNQEQRGWQYAPKGAMIFFDKKGTNPDGHVGIYLGDGKNIINAYGTVQEISIEDAMAKGDVGKYIGWSYPPEAWRPETSGKSRSNEPTGKTESTNAMSSEPKPTSTNIESTGQSETDFTITPANVQNNIVYHMAVVGDSIAWGTGLNKDEKYSYIVAKWLAEQLGRPVNVKILAHTGATIESSNANSNDPISYPIYHPELASATPTLMEQADKLPDNIDFVLVSGGANDVGLDNVLMLDYGILNRWLGSSVDDIHKKAEDIRPSMFNLLSKLLSKCPNARIVVTGYYTGISEDSKGITEVVATMEPDSQGLPGYRELDGKNKGQVVEKSNVFAVTANESLSTAVDEANKNMRTANSRNLPYDRAAFTPIFFPSERCYGADQSWLWKMEQDPVAKTIKTNDHMFETRKKLLLDSGLYCRCEPLATCISEPSSPKNVIENADSTPAIAPEIMAEETAKVCKKYQRDKLDAVGHPNVKGAKNYSESIIREIRASWPTWLQPTVEAFDVSARSLISGESLEISYKVSDNGGSGLKQVELWRTQEKDKWPEKPIQTKVLADENGPRGSFTDSPSAPGKYWYGVHVVDNADNWNDQKNSNSNGKPSGSEPAEVEVIGAEFPEPKAVEEAFGSADSNLALKGEIYYLEDGAPSLPDFNSLTPIGTIYANVLNISSRSFDSGFPGVTERFEWFAIKYTGTFNINQEGGYAFRLLSDDGSRLIIDGNLVIDNDGQHSPKSVSGKAYLTQGQHLIEVDYFQGPRYDIALQLFWTPPGGFESIFNDGE